MRTATEVQRNSGHPLCKVLRCPSPSAHRINLTEGDPDRLTSEIPICEEHHQRIASGEPYHVDADQGVILMGAALTAA